MKDRVAVSMILLLGTAALAGCDESRSGLRAGWDGVVRDSAGIRVVDNRGPAWATGEKWTVGDEPGVVLGQVDGPEEYQFFGIMGVRNLGGGRIAVANSSTQEIRIFDQAGMHEATVGGQGEGPGEFAWLQSLFSWRGDSIAAFDLDIGRLTVFSSLGELGRTILLSGGGGLPPLVPRGVLFDGSLVMEPNAGPIGQQDGGVIEGNERPVFHADSAIATAHAIRHSLPQSFLVLGELPKPKGLLLRDPDALRRVASDGYW